MTSASAAPTDLRFCANLGWLFTELPGERRFAAAAAAGFAGVEHADPYRLPLTTTKALLDDVGLTQVLINSPVGERGSPAERGWGCLPDGRSAFRDSVATALEYAVGLGCGLVHLRSGTVPDGTSVDAALARFTAHVAWAAEQAAAAGVRLTLEAINAHDMPGYLIDTQERAAAIVDAVGASHVGVQFDVYHCQRAQGDVTTRLAALGERVAHVQVADAPGRAEPGTGEIDYGYVLDRLVAQGYRGWVGCEYRPAAATVDGLGWMAPWRTA